jgi:hypothetical protein
VLKVVARSKHGTRIRRSKVRFTVAHRRPLAGAGVDRRIVRRSKLKLEGNVREHPHGPNAKGVRWKIVDVPRRSKLLRRSASKSAKGEPRGLRAPTSRAPTFKPDVQGTYELKMTVGSGAGGTTDRVLLHAVPPNPMVEVHTRVNAEGRPAIQVGKQTYVAPWLNGSRPNGSYYQSESFSSGGSGSNQAIFQVVVLDRTTLEFVANRTYGVCDTNNGTGTCRRDGGDQPVMHDLRKELLGLTDGLVIVNSLPAGQSDPTQPANFSQGLVAEHALADLSAIGFPAGTELEDLTADGPPGVRTQLSTAPADSLSVIGNPGLKPGQADFAIVPEAVYVPARGMSGWLMPDQTKHYQFVSTDRIAFDTRTEPLTCDKNGNNCTVTATLGLETLKTPLPNPFNSDDGGFQVAAYDPHTLERQEFQYFVTNTSHFIEQADPPFLYVPDMISFLKKHGQAGHLIVITSVRIGHPTVSRTLAGTGPDGQPVSAAEWDALARQVAAVGGTLNGFNTAASTRDSDYTLIGFGGADEGGGLEAIGKDARLQGALVRNSQSRYRPMNTTDVADAGAPSEALLQQVLQPPGQEPWPFANDRGVSAAMSYIGEQVGADDALLTADPRAAYWTRIDTAEKALEAKGDVDDFPVPIDQLAPANGPKPLGNLFTRDEFFTAKGQLSKELSQVAKVRTYFADLGAPTAKNNDAWPTTLTLADSLKSELDQATAEGKRKVDTFEIWANLFDIASLGAGGLAESAETALYAVSAGLEFADNLEAEEDGSDAESPRVSSDKAAQALHDRMESLSDSFKTLGDVAVSDYSKLTSFAKKPSPDDATADAMVKLGVERLVDETIVPYYFPVEDLDISYACAPQPNFDPIPCSPDVPPDPYTQYYCGGSEFHPQAPPPTGGNTPFGNGEDKIAPKEAWVQSLERLDPLSVPGSGHPASNNVYRTYIVTKRVNDVDEIYAWPPKDLLQHMFGTPVTPGDPTNSPLGISPLEWMREAFEAPDPHAESPVCGNWVGQA